MVLQLKTYLDNNYPIFIYVLTIFLLILWMYVDYAYAESASFCGKSCQAAKEKIAKEGTKVVTKCYGIHCDDTKKVEKTNENSTKAVTKTKCYGIHCDKEDAYQATIGGQVNRTTVKTPTTPTTKSTQTAQTAKTLKQQLTDFNYATNFISIRTSQACEASGTCPNYKVLADQFDNSNKYLSGDFYKNNKTGLWDRHSPIQRNAFEYYKYMNLPWVVFVNPDDYTWDRSKQIIIESQVHYVDRTDPIEYNTRYEREGLNINGCHSAVIGWNKNGSDILLDVLNSFYSNCKDPIKFDPIVKIFMESKIFEGCNQECFYHMEQFKRELQAEHLVSAELYGNNTVKETTKCYGIYCDKVKVKETRTKEEIVKDRQRELAAINECNRYQIWDDQRVEGKYRRDTYDCTVEKERDAYIKLVKPQVESGKINVPDEPNPDAKAIKECEDFRKYESTLDNQYSKVRASIVTCDDAYERDEYMQEMNRKYPNGVPK